MTLDQFLKSQMIDTNYIDDEHTKIVSSLKSKEKLLVTNEHYKHYFFLISNKKTMFINNEVRNRIKSLVIQNVRKNVKLMKLEFQPSS